MMNHCTGPLPRHLQVFVRRRFIEDSVMPGEPQMTRAIWFGLVSQPSRAWGCTVVLEYGAIYRNLPLHAIAFREDAPDIELHECQHWDCYGYGWSSCIYPYLDGQKMICKSGGGEKNGHYLFSVQPIGDGWSRIPEQSKEFTFIETEEGNLVAQPTDRTLVVDRSFTDSDLVLWPTSVRRLVVWPTWLRRQTEEWSVE